MAGSLSWQSASFPGREPDSSALFLLVSSFAFLAAFLARAASMAFSTMRLATWGFSSKNAPSFSFSRASTVPLTEVLPSLVLVWPSNFGSGIFTLTTATSPSLTSSPASAILRFFRRFFSSAYLFTVLVSEVRNPERWVPPSTLFMLLA